jgi:hypothetical protein
MGVKWSRSSVTGRTEIGSALLCSALLVGFAYRLAYRIAGEGFELFILSALGCFHFLLTYSSVQPLSL